MAKIEELKKYLTHEFSSGSYTGEDYRTFQTKYINYLKAICRENHWQLVNVGKNHYCFSAFIKSAENKCAYLSISDVRYFTNEWYGISSSARRRTNRTTAAGSTTIRRWKPCLPKRAELLDDLPFKEARYAIYH